MEVVRTGRCFSAVSKIVDFGFFVFNLLCYGALSSLL